MRSSLPWVSFVFGSFCLSALLFHSSDISFWELLSPFLLSAKYSDFYDSFSFSFKFWVPVPDISLSWISLPLLSPGFWSPLFWLSSGLSKGGISYYWRFFNNFSILLPSLFFLLWGNSFIYGKPSKNYLLISKISCFGTFFRFCFTKMKFFLNILCFGHIVDSTLSNQPYFGRLVSKIWRDLPDYFSFFSIAWKMANLFIGVKHGSNATF